MDKNNTYRPVLPELFDSEPTRKSSLGFWLTNNGILKWALKWITFGKRHLNLIRLGFVYPYPNKGKDNFMY